MDKVDYNQKFEQDRYVVVRNFIDRTLAELLHLYVESRASHTHFKQVYHPHLRESYYDGNLPGEDDQCPKSFSWYGDCMMDVLLQVSTGKMGEYIGCDLVPTYSFCRMYMPGEVLEKHKDRDSCEYSTTLCLGGDPWPIFVRNKQGQDIQIDLKPGDMLVYSGCELTHWREQFEGERCSQVFLHYNELNGKFNNMYDGRIGLGLPPFMNLEETVAQLESVSFARDNLLRILDSHCDEQEQQ